MDAQVILKRRCENRRHIVVQGTAECCLRGKMAKKNGSLNWAVAHARISLDRRPVAHFLHIGKTAGTAVKVALKEAPGSAKYRVVVQPHDGKLASIPETDHYFFCVRDPIDRYVSGFLSRKRQGQPRYFIPWTEGEAEAFERFDSPDALAVSLSGRHRATGRRGSDARHSSAAEVVLGLVPRSRILQEPGGPHTLDRASGVAGPEAACGGTRRGELGTADRPPACEQAGAGETGVVGSGPRQPPALVRKGLSVSRNLRRVGSLGPIRTIWAHSEQIETW